MVIFAMDPEKRDQLFDSLEDPIANRSALKTEMDAYRQLGGLSGAADIESTPEPHHENGPTAAPPAFVHDSHHKVFCFKGDVDVVESCTIPPSHPNFTYHDPVSKFKI